ncbi:hypothetical protein [Sinomonas sp. R1AF57]|uniref:hypothetical protein n=1 Tax=Sinomonas sp. R1AF57 TaxID=2020377 RepID=UPI001ABF946B|nr:hypothetical protein [Sinomonas sp. R1AF57]
MGDIGADVLGGEHKAVPDREAGVLCGPEVQGAVELAGVGVGELDFDEEAGSAGGVEEDGGEPVGAGTCAHHDPMGGPCSSP